MQFAKGAWKILVAIKDALVLLFMLLFFLMLAIILSSRPNAADVTDGILHLDIEGVIVEQAKTVDPFAALSPTALPMREYEARDIIRTLDAAKDDERIKAVVLDLDSFLGGGQVTLAAVANKIAEVKKAGKPVYAHALYYTDDSFQLAAAASEIWVDPLGAVTLTGPGGSRLYYKQALDKYGVEPHIYRVGTYKSAVEPYFRSDMSPEARENAEGYLGTMWEAYKERVAAMRPNAQVKRVTENPMEVLETGEGSLAEKSKALGLVDRIGNDRDFADYVAKKTGIGDYDDWRELPGANFDDYLADLGEEEQDGGAIGLVTVEGEIVDGEGGPGEAAGDTISDIIYDALRDNDLKALVVRVDSPGGSVLASEKIRLAIAEAKKQGMPVIVSMANVAASGGYWISTPADAIYAEPGTITGSIGVFGVLPTFAGTLQQFGITSDGVTTTPLAGQPDLYGGTNESFDAAAQASVDDIYARFLGYVAASRGKTSAEIDKIAQGRVWAGGDARQIGLIDRYGNLDDAMAEAAKRAKLGDDWHAKIIEPQENALSWLFGEEFADSAAPNDLFGRASLEQRAAMTHFLSDMQMLAGVRGVQASCLECSTFAPSGSDYAEASGDALGWLSRTFGGR